ncbi:MAG TPA: mechanosensitive ion channel [Saprospiraceae bacterium]|nr:mechanosensitive ion channel [Saprospiraceae bacterium]
MEQFDKYYDLIIRWSLEYLPKFLLALLVLVIGFWLIKRVRILVRIALEKSDFNVGIISFLVSLVDIVLKTFLLLVVAGMIGIETASLIGVLAAAGFAVGLALQGSLSNFAAGILVVTFKPYKAGDWIEVEDKFGKVEDIQIFNTIIVTPGQKTLIIPNGQVVNGIVTNFSKKGHIRVEIEIAVPYEESFPKIRDIVMQVVEANGKVLPRPAPEIGILKFDSHNVVMAVRPYVEPDNYWQVVFEVHQSVKAAFHEHGIKVAYPEGVEIGFIGN